MQKGDVILGIDGHPVQSDGFMILDGERVEMPEIVERKFKGDSVKFEVLRDKKKLELTAKLNEVWPYQLQANQYDIKPRYVLFGGLLFEPLSRNFLEAFQIEDLRVRYNYNSFLTNELYKERPELVILSTILPDPINTYLGDLKNGIVDQINGAKIRNLKEMAAAFAKPAQFYVIKLVGEGRPIVFESAAVESARERIKDRYNVLAEQNLSDNPQD